MVEAAFIYEGGPEPAERSQPVEAELCVHRGLDETGLAQQEIINWSGS